MTPSPSFEPRAVCLRCRRPRSVCYCAHVTPIPTATRVVLLQHPRERDVPIGTARIAHLCLPNSELHVGVHWQDSAALGRALDDHGRPAALLYPGEGAIDIARHPPTGPLTLVVVDGTWSQARKLVRENPRLAALPRYAFVPPAPSEYRIRREPHESFVSTLEALSHVLGILEGDPARFRSMLAPFRAMVDAQVACAERIRGARVRHPRAPRPPRPRVPLVLGERASDLVCVVGEANAWPYRSDERSALHPDELVQWVAHRVATGETFEAVAAPRQPLAPYTTMHTGLSAADLGGGGPLDALLRGFAAFLRDTDVVCSWGCYATSLFVASGGVLPASRVDLRHASRTFAERRVGTLEDLLGHLAIDAGPPLARGRAGVRLAQTAAVARRFAAEAEGFTRPAAPPFAAAGGHTARDD